MTRRQKTVVSMEMPSHAFLGLVETAASVCTSLQHVSTVGDLREYMAGADADKLVALLRDLDGLRACLRVINGSRTKVE